MRTWRGNHEPAEQQPEPEPVATAARTAAARAATAAAPEQAGPEARSGWPERRQEFRQGQRREQGITPIESGMPAASPAGIPFPDRGAAMPDKPDRPVDIPPTPPMPGRTQPIP